MVIFLDHCSSLEEQRRRVAQTLRDRALDLEVALERIRSEDAAKNELIPRPWADELRNPLGDPRNLGFNRWRRRLCGPARDSPREKNALIRKCTSCSAFFDYLLHMTANQKETAGAADRAAHLRDCIKLSADSIGKHVTARRQHLSVSLPDHPIMMMADPIRIEQIFVNY